MKIAAAATTTNNNIKLIYLFADAPGQAGFPRETLWALLQHIFPDRKPFLSPKQSARSHNGSNKECVLLTVLLVAFVKLKSFHYM